MDNNKLNTPIEEIRRRNFVRLLVKGGFGRLLKNDKSFSVESFSGEPTKFVKYAQEECGEKFYIGQITKLYRGNKGIGPDILPRLARVLKVTMYEFHRYDAVACLPLKEEYDPDWAIVLDGRRGRYTFLKRVISRTNELVRCDTGSIALAESIIENTKEAIIVMKDKEIRRAEKKNLSI